MTREAQRSPNDRRRSWALAVFPSDGLTTTPAYTKIHVPILTNLHIRERQSIFLGQELSFFRGVGLHDANAAESLGISRETVKSHVRSIYRKLQVGSAAEAVSRALRDRLI